MRFMLTIAFVFVAILASPMLFAQDTPELECEGEGRIHTIPDECIHDGGATAMGDSLEQRAFGLSFASEDRVEGTTAFVEKRDPAFKGR